MSTLNKSMRPVASFTFKAGDQPQRLCLVPGHYCTEEVVTSGDNAFVSFANPSAIQAAGYECDQVADDFYGDTGSINKVSDLYPIIIKPKSPKTRYRDFLRFSRYSNLKVTKMRITDLSTGANPSRDIFYTEMEVTQSAIGAKCGSDIVQFSEHINPGNYLQNFIEINLEEKNLKLDETTLVFLQVPANAEFQIDFTLAPTI